MTITVFINREVIKFISYENRGFKMYSTLETERVILRPFCEDDVQRVFDIVRIYNEQHNNKGYSKIRTIEDAKKLNDNTIKTGNEWFIIHKETQAPIGWVLCAKIGSSDIQKKAFLHFWIRTDYQNIGLGQEILEKVLHFAFFGIKTAFVVANAKNKEKLVYHILSKFGFKIFNYVPKNKPDDDDTLVQFRMTREAYISQPHVVATVYDYIDETAKSPYSYESPIREIDSINYIKEPTGYLCGQSVIAMLADVSVDEVISIMQTDKDTSTSYLRDALKWYGIKTTTKTRIKYTEGAELPACCILSVTLPEYGHWSLYYKGKFYDPEFGILDELPKNARLVSYWEIII